MKTTTFVSAAVAVLAASVHAQQDPGPSPTASVGCVPHGDHWDCEGPAATPAPAGESSAAAGTTAIATTHESHAAGTADPGPSPTESTGCVPHGDHWDCEGPAVTPAPAAGTTTTATTHESHAAGTADPGPSPTESTGCVPHGDHWDCEGPAAPVTTATHHATSTLSTAVVPATTAPANTTAPGNATTSPTGTSSPTPFAGAAAAGAKLQYGAMALIAGLVSMMVMSA